MTRHRTPPPSAVSVELEVPFHHVDVLEVARTALLRSRRLDAPDMRALGYRFYVAESHIRHVFPMR